MKNFLEGPTIQLLPFEPQYGDYLARWYYDTTNKGMYRHFARALTLDQFRNYNTLIQGEVFMMYHKKEQKIVGYIQGVPDVKSNGGVFIGILLEPEFQHTQVSSEAFILFSNYLFNRLNYRKLIVEILASNEPVHKGLLKYGFRQEGHFFEEAFIDGKFVDEIRLTMTSAFYNKNIYPKVQSWQQQPHS